MTKQKKYSASLTGASFLFYEMKQFLRLKEQGLSEEDIREKAYSDNIFQYKTKSSINRVLPSIIRRSNCLNKELENIILNGTIDYGKAINLYSIMKTDRLFFEFMSEVVKEKIQLNGDVIEKKDINIFFITKFEQSEIISRWSDSTVAKLKQVMLKILLEAGIIESIKTGKTTRLIIPLELKKYLIDLNEEEYLNAMGSM